MNLVDPERIQAIREHYITAGGRYRTNMFGACAGRLERSEFAGRTTYRRRRSWRDLRGVSEHREWWK